MKVDTYLKEVIDEWRCVNGNLPKYKMKAAAKNKV